MGRGRASQVDFICTKGKLTANANYYLSFDINRAMTIFIDTDMPWGSSSIQQHINVKWVRTCFVYKWSLDNCRNNYPADWIYSDAIPTSSFWVQRRSATNCQREERWEFIFSCIVAWDSEVIRIELGGDPADTVSLCLENKSKAPLNQSWFEYLHLCYLSL